MTGSTVASNVSRRSFIAGAAALTGAGLLASCMPQAQAVAAEGDETQTVAGNEEIFSGACCGNCAGGCFLNVHVRDGRIVRTTARDLPDPAYTRICSKGLSQVGRVYNANRLLYPMKRVGERGSDDFERISWDEALDFIATKWKEITDEFGPGAMAVFNNSGHYALASGSCGTTISSLGRFKNVVGASEISSSLDIGSSFGTQHCTGGVPTYNEITDRINSKVNILWGNNPAVSNPHNAHFFKEAQENGNRYIVIDPIFNANAAKADWWIPVKAGTDGALAAGILNIYFTRGLLDEAYLKNSTNCPYLIKEDGMFVRMSDLGQEPTTTTDPTTGAEVTVDPIVVWDLASETAVALDEATDPALENVPAIEGLTVQTVYENAKKAVAEYTPERSAEICGLTVDDVEELARIYVEDGPVSTEFMLGLNHYLNAPYTAWLVDLVPILTGNTGKPGASLGMTEVYIPQYSMVNMGVTMPTDKAGNPCQGGDPHTYATAFLEDLIDTGKYGSEEVALKGVWFNCNNAAATMADYEYTKRWVSKLDLVITSDVMMTDTCRLSDIVLPASYWFEHTDVGAFLFATHPYILWNEKAIEPLGESKPDFDIFKAVAEKMGYGEFFDLTEEEYIAEALDSEGFKALGISLDALKENRAMRVYGPDTYVSDTTMWGNENGRLALYQENVMYQFGDLGQPVDRKKECGLYWEEGKYCGEHSEARTGDYPFHLLSQKMRTHTHTQWSENEYVREIEPEPLAMLNPTDAEELGVVDGDTIRLTNDQGTLVVKAAVNAGVPPKTVAMPRSWQAADFIEGTYQNLISKEFNDTSNNQAYNDVACAVEKM